MDKRIIQTYSTWAKENLENQIEVSLKALGINNESDIKKAKRVGDVTTIEGDPTSYPADLYGKRALIIELVKMQGYKNIIEEFAYTWFNRFVALRFMEVHGFLSHGFRVLSNPAGGIEPEILKNLDLVKDDLKLDMNLCNEFKQQGKIEELFRHVLIKQCDVLSGILPMLFSSDMGYLDLILPKNLLKGETVITKLNEIPEAAFMDDVEVIGWMYQFYVADRRQQYRNAKIVTKELIPTLTQVFTTDWIVRYLADNSVGRLWLESYPNSKIRSQLEYYVNDPIQTDVIKKQQEEIMSVAIKPEDIKILEPCCGSGHILAYIFDLLYKMYEEKGYQKREIPTLILNNNLFGLEIDKRAAQIATFSLIMKARAVNTRFFNKEYYTVPQIYEITDSRMLDGFNYKAFMQEKKIFSLEEINAIIELIELFHDAKTVGSLIKVRNLKYSLIEEVIYKIEHEIVSDIFSVDFINYGTNALKKMVNQAKIMDGYYDVLITNPPYLGISKMEDRPKEYLTYNYPDSKADMFGMFMEALNVKKGGFRAIVNPDSWMFLQSFESLRQKVINSNSIITMVHLGLGAFDATVSTTAFVLRNAPIKAKGVFYRLVKEKDKMNGFKIAKPIISSIDGYDKIPGSPIAYWVNDTIFEAYSTGRAFPGETRKGVLTGANDIYLRLWYEVNPEKIGDDIYSHDEMVASKYKWFFVTSGGNMRKWYGNIDTIVNLENDGLDIRTNVKNFRLRENKYYFLEAVTWTEVCSSTFSSRYVPKGVLFGNGGPVSFFFEGNLKYCLGLLNSNVVMSMMAFLAPTLNYGPEQISRIPFICKNQNQVENVVDQCISISKEDWDSFEISWDYEEHPLVRWSKSLWDATAIGKTMYHYYGENFEVNSPVELCFMLWQGECKKRFDNLKADEEELNRIFIDIYGLQDELTSDIEDKDVTVRLADRERDIRSLISYLVGIAMGRYSLDVPGLAYAGGDWDATKYVTYQPDDDGIIPIYNGIGMEDGLTTVLIKLIKQIYGEDTYRQNIDFIAEALGKNSNESSEETLNRYLNDGFYADHLKIYQKRPIYWLFTSGRYAGFKCLIYMNRYNEDTLARINGKYFLPEFTRKKNELEELNGRITHAEGRDKLKLEKQRQNLAAAYNEAVEYGQILDHMANRYISIDLDDGVKDNYAKFQGVEIVTDGGSKVKKDLLAALK